MTQKVNFETFEALSMIRVKPFSRGSAAKDRIFVVITDDTNTHRIHLTKKVIQVSVDLNVDYDDDDIQK